MPRAVGRYILACTDHMISLWLNQVKHGESSWRWVSRETLHLDLVDSRGERVLSVSPVTPRTCRKTIPRLVSLRAAVS